MRPYGDIFTTVKRNEAVLIDDIRGDSPLALDYRNAVGGEIDRAFAMVRSWMAVPMTAKGNLIGLIFVAHDQPGTYTERDLALAQAVANQAAFAIDNARLFEETEERTRELQTLLDVSTNVASTIDLQTLVDVIVEQVGVVADYDRASVLVLEDDASALRVMTLRRKGDAAPVGAPPDTKFPVAEAPLMWGEFNAGRAVVIDDVRDESDPLAGDYRASAAPRTDPMLEATRSWMGVPLIS
jgi:GAF domain-containing protein